MFDTKATAGPSNRLRAAIASTCFHFDICPLAVKNRSTPYSRSKKAARPCENQSAFFAQSPHNEARMDNEQRMTSTEMQLEIVFGLHFATAAALRALLTTCPNKDAFLTAFEHELANEHAETIEAARSALTATAMADYAALLRRAVKP
ncbi:hypothetical protein ACJ51O_35585 (plasmid) [Burkholderia pyrrocinia]|uniref:hypothetical protein n=1 Tax=Burkholderia pyrrocinia TaxID=60550 RepID=UPI0038B66070